MSDRIDLPGEHWAVLKDPMEITERQARALQRKFMEVGRQARPEVGSVAQTTPDPTKPAVPAGPNLTDEQLDLITEFEHEVVAYFITEWDFEFPPTAEAMNDLPVPVYRSLDDATEPLVGVLIPALAKKSEAGPTTP